MSATSITVEADRDYVRKLAVLARERDTTIAMVVRCGLNYAMGVDLENFAIFFEEHCAQMRETDDESAA